MDEQERIDNPADAREIAEGINAEMTAAVKTTEAAEKLGDLAANGTAAEQDAHIVQAKYGELPLGAYDRAVVEVSDMAELIEKNQSAESGAHPEPGRVLDHVDEAAAIVKKDHIDRANWQADRIQEKQQAARKARVEADKASLAAAEEADNSLTGTMP